MSSPRTKEVGASRARRIVAGSVAAFVLACLPGATLSGLASAEDQLKENKQELSETRDKVRTRSKRIRALQKHMNGLATRISRSQSDILAAEQRIEMLARFFRESRTRRLYVALHDVEHVAKRCPRLIALLGSFPTGLFIFQTQGEAAKVQDCFALADGDHLVRRPVRTQPRGVLVINDPKECQPMRERFDEIWESSVPAVSASTTGL